MQSHVYCALQENNLIWLMTHFLPHAFERNTHAHLIPLTVPTDDTQAIRRQ